MEASIIIPTYNERKNIEKLIPHIEKVISENSIDSEIIVIDDNSPDKTGGLAEEFNKKYKNIRVIHRKSKQGVGSARRLGFEKASKKIIISMEGDNTHNPKYIPLFIKKIEQGADLVIGSRYLKDSKIINWPLKRKIVSKFANLIARFFAGTKITDVTNGYRAFTKDLFSSLTIDSTSFPFNMEFVCEAWSRNFKIDEIPIVFIDRKEGKSKLSVGKEFISFINTAFRFAYTYRPMKVFGSLGFLLILIGILHSIYLIYLKITIGVIGNRIPLIFLAVVLILSGIQIISFGLIVNVMSKLRREILK
ncbi:polyprenol monophosphomannose synthase [Candidatus Woesearchaeota archaeon]|nr:polyprenol monophosphomannose synthase [Candidatus Woesearchaeota archaeon]